MSFPANFNVTQQAEVLETLFKATASSVAPVMLLECFILGVLCASVPIVSYLLWVKHHSFPRTPFISIIWIVFTMMVTHWVLFLRQLETTLSGRAMGISITLNAIWRGIDSYNIGRSYNEYGAAWELLLTLVTETVLFGFASFLFAVTVYAYFWPALPRWRSCYSLIIPTMATIMYTLSLAHWVVTIRFFTLVAGYASAYANNFNNPLGNENLPDGLEVVLLGLLSANAVMSDSIVIWRMCVVWDRSRPVLVFGSALLLATLGLNTANIVVNARSQLELLRSQIPENVHDTEIILTYGENVLGLAAAFVSLGSNFCATMLVGMKAWLHRRQFSRHSRPNNGRTLVERVMEIIVDSGVVYTAIWLLYCISFFRKITTYHVLVQDPKDGIRIVTAVDHLDAAMAQITSIYPLTVFILVALDKIHYSRGPRMLRKNERPRDSERDPAVTVTFEIDAERSMALGPTSVYPMVALSGINHSPSAVDNAKIAVSGDA